MVSSNFSIEIWMMHARTADGELRHVGRGACGHRLGQPRLDGPLGGRLAAVEEIGLVAAVMLMESPMMTL